MAQGLSTPLVAAGYLLAKLTHAPNLTFISAIGQTFCQEFAPLGLTTVENLWLKNGLFTINFITGVCDFLPRYRPKEFFRPGQVDALGNFNNVFMGGTYEKPRLRLPGSAGIADVTVYEENVCLYVPRHGRHVDPAPARVPRRRVLRRGRHARAIGRRRRLAGVGLCGHPWR